MSKYKKKHVNGRDWQLRISSILLFSYILLLLISLEHGNSFLLIAVFLCILIIKRKIKVADIGFLLILYLSFVIYLLCTHSVWMTAYPATGLLGITAITVFYLILSGTDKHEFRSEKLWNIFDIILLFLILLCLEQLIKYAFSYIGNWKARRNGLPLFIGNVHHVDFSVLVFITFLLGMKRGYKRISITFAIISLFILPTRTYYLSIIAFVFCSIFKDVIYRVCSWKIFRKSFLWIAAFAIGSALFSWIWTGPMNQELEATRFQATLYTIQVIFKQKLFLTGFDNTIDYGSIIPNFNWKYVDEALRPHNSYFSLFLYYSLFYGGCYLYSLSRIIDRVFSKEMVPYIIPYLFAGWVLHDMFIGGRLLLYLIVLTVPFKERCKAISCSKRYIGNSCTNIYT